MVLRKPYAFLIKHFRMIHVILLGLFGFICFRSHLLYVFLTKYIADSRIVTGFEDLSQMYIGFPVYLVLFLIILVSITIIVLLTQKKKPRTFYYIIVLYYMVLFILLIFTGSVLDTIRFEAMDTRTMEALKDTFFVFYLVQYVFMLISFVRAIGFNVKRFDFQKDLLEFELDEKDNEEFEVNIGLDSEDIISKIRYFFRNFRYIYRENKIIFVFFASFLVLIVFVVVAIQFMNREVIYSENETFTTSFYEITVLNSYKLTKDYSGNTVSKNNFYLVLQMRFKNITNENRILDISNTKIYYGDDVSYTPDRMVYNSFSDLGNPYYGEYFLPGETKEFILVYGAPREYENERFRFGYLVGSKVDENVSEYIYTKVALKPKEVVEDKEVTKTAKLNEPLTFQDSVFGNTTLTVKSSSFSNSYLYHYHTCENQKCTDTTNYLAPTTNTLGYATTIMRIEYDLNFDDKIKNHDLASFISKYSSISYVVNGTEYDSERTIFKEITPIYIPGYSYFEVVDRVERAEQVYLNFKIRGKKYRYLIFDNTVKETEEGE